MASESVTCVRTPKLVWRKEKSDIDRAIVEINELADVVYNDVEVPIEIDCRANAGKKTKAIDI